MCVCACVCVSLDVFVASQVPRSEQERVQDRHPEGGEGSAAGVPRQKGDEFVVHVVLYDTTVVCTSLLCDDVLHLQCLGMLP